VFRLLGFDVTVRPGFLYFCGLLVLLYRDSFGLWLAGSLAVFTLVHELGHAVAARSSGAEAAISLDFMAGYTSFVPKQPLSKWSRVLISVAGPLVEIVVAIAVLAAMGINAFDLDNYHRYDAGGAIWWAGIAVGALNLIPVLPLDGGHVAQTGLEAVLRRPALREMAIASLVTTIGVAVAMAVVGHIDFVIFIAFLLVGQIQLVQATSTKPRGLGGAASTWNTDAFGLTAGARPSPWQLAYGAVVAGDRDRASRIILDDLASPTGGRGWTPPSDAPVEALAAVVDTLPDELPPGNAFSETVLVQVLMAVGQVRRAGEYAAEGFARHRTPLLATVVVRAAARLGDAANALEWVGATGESMHDASPGERAATLHVLDNAPELNGIRDDPRFQSARIGL
jgi:Zn-dependent protease